jgi:tRNA uridine 5-carbamoylmethylation protein Kti12
VELHRAQDAGGRSLSSAGPILILTGAPGVGKTTVARLLAGRSERAVHLESDRFFHFIASGYIEPWKPESREQNALVMRIIGEAAAAYAAAGYFTIVEGIVIPGFFFEPLRDWLRQAGHQVEFAVLRAPLDVCQARAATRDSQPLADPQVVDQLWKQFDGLGPLEANVVEVSAKRPAEVADVVAAALREGSLTA